MGNAPCLRQLKVFLSMPFLKAAVAPAGYSRWYVAIAALSIHLSIGQVYAFSVFNLPLTRLIGVSAPAAEDWSLAAVSWIFSIAIAVLGLTAAFSGRWLRLLGPRPTVLLAALCFGGGFWVSGLGIWLHNLPLTILGYGVFGGVGLGLGYITPVATLMRWFPDRPGLASGLAIMGFGGGAIIGAPLAVALMDKFATASSNGVLPAFLIMGTLYLAAMTFGAILLREPAGDGAETRAEDRPVTAPQAMRTRQFYLLWAMLCLNVTAGIGVISQAAPMLQEMFPAGVTEGVAATMVGVLSVANMVGRFGWSAVSDRLGRRATFTTFFALGIAMYLAIPALGGGSLWLTMACLLVILSMYGGSFATMPAYVKDVFGMANLGAIYGRMLTAWSVAGVLGPVLVSYLRELQIAQGVPRMQAYSVTLVMMAGLLMAGLVCARLMRPLEQGGPQLVREVA